VSARREGFPIQVLLDGIPVAKITQEPEGIAIWLKRSDLPDWCDLHKTVPSLPHAQSFLDTYFL
jgi:hypothetical protein